MATEMKIITIVKIDWTTAPKIRMTARKDLPEYGIKAGDVFYLVRSSKADTTNEYYICRWDYTGAQWACGCPSRKPCRHMKLVSVDCQNRTPKQPIVQMAAQPVSEKTQAVEAAEAIIATAQAETPAQSDPDASLKEVIAYWDAVEVAPETRVTLTPEEQCNYALLNGNRPFSLGIVVEEKVAACEVTPAQVEAVEIIEVPDPQEIASGMIYSDYQKAIFKAVQNGEKNIVVSAVPGSGKSTTIRELIRFLPEGASVLALAFNVDAAKDLGNKLNTMLDGMRDAGIPTPVVESRTIHSLGNATLTNAGLRCQTKSNKYFVLSRSFLEERFTDNANTARQVAKLIDMVRLTLSGTDEESLIRLVNRFEIDLDPSDESLWKVVLKAVPTVMQAGIAQAKKEKIIDFTDMIYLPHVLNLQPRRYDYVLVDEAQDLSPCQRALVLKARKSGGAFIAVGDHNQAIYGFAGASLRSIDEIIEETGAVELPLSICYRCPKEVVNLASSIYEGIEAAPNAEDGKVEHIVNDKVSSLARSGDLILCRLTAPLVKECLQFLRQGIRANVRGRDLGASFTSLIDKVAKLNYGMILENLEECVIEFKRKQIEALSLHADDNELKISALEDKVDTLLALREAYAESEGKSATLKGFIAYIEQFFKEDKDAQIILSTVHRAKGQEEERVFILQSDKMPHPKAKTPEQLTQEYNLMYVAYTRAQESLYLVVDRLATQPSFDDEEQTV